MTGLLDLVTNFSHVLLSIGLNSATGIRTFLEEHRHQINRSEVVVKEQLVVTSHDGVGCENNFLTKCYYFSTTADRLKSHMCPLIASDFEAALHWFERQVLLH